MIQVANGKIVLVEDDFRAIEGFVRKLEAAVKGYGCRCDVETREAPKLDSNEALTDSDTQMVVVDYELTRKRSDETIPGYAGGALVRALREERQDIPLVVVTRPEVFGRYSEVRSLGDTADLVFFKNTLDDAESGLGRKLVSLINGYASISKERRRKHNWKLLMEVLKASEEESMLLNETNPPIGPDDSPRTEDFGISDSLPPCGDVPFRGWTAHDVSRWVIGILFKYPGLLYDLAYASTCLGVRPRDFGVSQIQSLLVGTRYQGVFSDFGNYWWRGRLRNTAASLVEETGFRPLHEIFVPWLRKSQSVRVAGAKCNSSGTEYADTVCYVLREPVKTAYSLAYYPDNRPSIMDVARVSYKAVKTSNRVKRRLIGRSDWDLFDAIRKGESETFGCDS